MSATRLTVILEGLLRDAKSDDKQVKQDAMFKLVGHARERIRWLVKKQLVAADGLRRFIDSDDVVQNAALEVLEKIDEGQFQTPETPRHFFSFVNKMLRSRLVDLRRRFALRETQTLESAGERPDPLLCSEIDDLDELLAAMGTLTDEEHELYTEHYVHERKPIDIAAEIGVSEATVWRRLAFMHDKLGRRMGIITAAN